MEEFDSNQPLLVKGIKTPFGSLFLMVEWFPPSPPPPKKKERKKEMSIVSVNRVKIQELTRHKEIKITNNCICT